MSGQRSEEIPVEVVVTSMDGRGGAWGCPGETGRYARTVVRDRDLGQGAARDLVVLGEGRFGRRCSSPRQRSTPPSTWPVGAACEELNPLDMSLLDDISLLSVISRRAGGTGGAVAVSRGRRWVRRRRRFIFSRKPRRANERIPATLRDRRKKTILVVSCGGNSAMIMVRGICS
jgi:hypothetical protein